MTSSSIATTMSRTVAAVLFLLLVLLSLVQQQQQPLVVATGTSLTSTSATTTTTVGLGNRHHHHGPSSSSSSSWWNHRHHGRGRRGSDSNTAIETSGCDDLDDIDNNMSVNAVAEVSSTTRRRRPWTRTDSERDSSSDGDEHDQDQDQETQQKEGASWWKRRTMKKKKEAETKSEDDDTTASKSKSKESEETQQNRRSRWILTGRKKKDSDPPSKSDSTSSTAKKKKKKKEKKQEENKAQTGDNAQPTSSSSSSSQKPQRKMKFGRGLFQKRHRKQQQQPPSPSESESVETPAVQEEMKPESKTKSTAGNQTSTSIQEEEDDDDDDHEEEEEEEEEGDGEIKKAGSQIETNTTKSDEGLQHAQRQQNTTTTTTDQQSHTSSSPTVVYGYRVRPVGSSGPTPIGISRASPYSSPSHPQQQQPEAAELMAGRMTAILVMAVASVIQNLTRLWVIQWLARKIAGESQLMEPRQHFIWECLNDKYTKDEEVWNNVLTKNLPPIGFHQRKWNKHIKTNMLQPQQPQKNKKNDKKKNQKIVGEDDGSSVKDVATTMTTASKESVDPKTVVVIDLSTSSSQLDVHYLADVVTFLVGAQQNDGDDETLNIKRKQMFGPEPEIILSIESGGGEVTLFALAAAQIARLRSSGWKVTACVDRIAASGGYMIASQADQVFGAPFAIVGSIGVISGGLNFNPILQKYGIKAIELKSGDQKNPISQFGPVSDKDMKIAQKKSDETHRDFIDLCLSRRPMLREDVCDGRVLNGGTAREVGLIDRVLTSDEYIYEKIVNGDVVMKLHRFAKPSDRTSFVQALQILPHLRQKVGTFFNKLVSFDGNSPQASFRGSSVQPDLAANIFKGLAFLSMVHSALKNKGLFGS